MGLGGNVVGTGAVEVLVLVLVLVVVGRVLVVVDVLLVVVVARVVLVVLDVLVLVEEEDVDDVDGTVVVESVLVVVLVVPDPGSTMTLAGSGDGFVASGRPSSRRAFTSVSVGNPGVSGVPIHTSVALPAKVRSSAWMLWVVW